MYIGTSKVKIKPIGSVQSGPRESKIDDSFHPNRYLYYDDYILYRLKYLLILFTLHWPYCTNNTPNL